MDVTDTEKEMIRKVVIEKDNLRQENEGLKQEVAWLTNQLYSKKLDAETGWKPDDDIKPTIYRGYKLTKMRPYGFIIVENIDGTKPPQQLQSSYTTYDIAH